MSLPPIKRVGIFCWECPSTTSKNLCPFLFMAETPTHLGKNFWSSLIIYDPPQRWNRAPICPFWHHTEHLHVDTTARTSISSTYTCFKAPLMRIYALWGGVSSPCPVCLLSPESKWTGHLDVEHGKGGN